MAVVELRLLQAAEYAQVPDLVRLLEPELEPLLLVARMHAMLDAGWRCLGVFADGALVGVAGFSERCHLFSGSVLFVENVVLLPALRGHGLGERLMAWLEQHARERGCLKLTLDAYASNAGARRFYQRLGYDPRGVHFVRELD